MKIEHIDHLINTWSQGRTYMPSEARRKIQELVNPITTVHFAEILGQIAKYQLLDDQALFALTNQATARAYMWGVLGYAIGGESALQNIRKEDEPLIHLACDEPFMNYFTDFIVGLIAKKKMDQEAGYDQMRNLRLQITKISVALSNLGWLFYFQPNLNSKKERAARSLLN